MILHVDMDAFYASVEELDRPELCGQCVIVGGTSGRGVVSAANYAARKFGVHSAMPVFQARQKCPDAVFVPPRMERYQSVSRTIMALLKEMTPLVEVVSIDEAYIDISGCGRLYGEPAAIGMRVKQRIKETVGLTCSVGIAPLKFLAKIASEQKKPDGFFLITPEDTPRFIEALPIEKVPGVGKTARNNLWKMGIRRLGDIRLYPENTVADRLGKLGVRLIALSKGADAAKVTPHSPTKSVSRERTLGRDTSDKDLLRRHILNFSDIVAHDLRRLGVKARTVTLKLKDSDFKLTTRSVTLPKATESARVLFQAAEKLLNDYPLKKAVRLVGMGASSLSEKDSRQLEMFGASAEESVGWLRVEKAMDSITEKFGTRAVRRASLNDGEE